MEQKGWKPLIQIPTCVHYRACWLLLVAKLTTSSSLSSSSKKSRQEVARHALDRITINWFSSPSSRSILPTILENKALLPNESASFVTHFVSPRSATTCFASSRHKFLLYQFIGRALRNDKMNSNCTVDFPAWNTVRLKRGCSETT